MMTYWIWAAVLSASLTIKFRSATCSVVCSPSYTVLLPLSAVWLELVGSRTVPTVVGWLTVTVTWAVSVPLLACSV